MVNSGLDPAFDLGRLLGRDARDQESLLTTVEMGGDFSDLFRRFARAVNDFGKPFSQCAMVIDLGKAKIGHRRSLKSVQRFGQREFAFTKLLQEQGRF